MSVSAEDPAFLNLRFQSAFLSRVLSPNGSPIRN